MGNNVFVPLGKYFFILLYLNLTCIRVYLFGTSGSGCEGPETMDMNKY
jgi:hypothetical protein